MNKNIKMFHKVSSTFIKISNDICYRDLTFLCGGHSMSYHQAMVIPLSPMMESIVQGEVCQPSLPFANVTISLDQVNPNTLKALMDLLYTGKSSIDNQNTSEVQDLVEMLGLEVDVLLQKAENIVENKSIISSTVGVINSENATYSTETLLMENMSVPKKKQSIAWNFFSLQDDGAKCNLCQKLLKIKDMTNMKTSGMVRHLKTLHASALDDQDNSDSCDTIADATLDEMLDSKELNESINAPVQNFSIMDAPEKKVNEFEVKTSDLKEFANKKMAEKLEAKHSKNSSKPKPTPVELYDSSHSIWGFYSPLVDGRAKCNTCSRDISRSMGKNDYMVKHMSYFHPEVYSEYISKKYKKSSVVNQSSYRMHDSKETLTDDLPENTSSSFCTSSFLNVSSPSNASSAETLKSSLKTDDSLNERKRLLSDLIPSIEQKQKPAKKKKKTKDSKEIKIEEKDENDELEEVFLVGLKDDMNEVGDDLRFQSGKKKTSVIWNFFSEVDSTETKDVNAKCNFCYTEVSRPHGTTSKLRDHLRKHKLIFKEWKRINESRKQSGSDLDTSYVDTSSMDTLHLDTLPMDTSHLNTSNLDTLHLNTFNLDTSKETIMDDGAIQLD